MAAALLRSTATQTERHELAGLVARRYGPSMTWSAVREAYRDRWLVLELLGAHTLAGRRYFERIVVVEECPDGRTAMKRCSVAQRAHPERDYLFAHTSRRELEVYERSWVGVRWGDAADPAA